MLKRGSFLLAALFSLNSFSVTAWADDQLKVADFITALESYHDKEFKEILVSAASEYIGKYPDASNLDAIHFKIATVYHDRKKVDRSFFEHIKFVYLYPNSTFTATAEDRIRTILVQKKKYKKSRVTVEELLSRNHSADAGREQLLYDFVKDFYDLRLEPVRDYLTETCAEFLAAFPKSGKSVEVMFWRAELLRDARKPHEAFAEYLKLTYLHNGSLHVTSSRLAMAELLAGKLDTPEKAVYTLEELLLEYPNDPQAAQAQYQIGKIHEQKNKKYLEAINSYTAVAKKYPKSVEAVPAMFDAAELYEKKFKEYDQAIRIYTEIVRDFPEDLKSPHAMAEAARIYEKRLKDYFNAANVYFKVYGNYPESAIAAESLFAAAEISEKRLENYDQALEYYRLVTDNFPESKLAKKAMKRIEKVSKKVIDN